MKPASFLLKFALAAIILTILFRYFLSYGIENQSSIIIVLSAVLYGISMFISGWFFGKRDGEYLPIFDVGFRFHLVTYIIHNLISELWFILGYNSIYENIDTIHSTALIWGVFILLHFILFLWARKNSISSLDKEDLFD